jgi:carbamoyltransferase
MKIILGINAHHADSSACIIINNKIVVAMEEERINRKKHFSGFPIESIRECLRIAKIEDTEVTDIAFNTKPLSNIIFKGFFFLKNLNLKNYNSISRYRKKLNIKSYLSKDFKFKKNIKIHYIEHHLAHIASAYYPSNYEDAVGLSIDGSGDFVTLAIAKCHNHKIKITEKVFFPNSLGIFYHAMTQFLGFKNYGDEYKIMGMAAYGEPKYFDKIKDNLFKLNNNDNFELNLHYFDHQKSNFKYVADENLIIDDIFNQNLSRLFVNELNDDHDQEQFKKDFACSVQKTYEHFFIKILEKIKNFKFSKNLVFAGGCALNSSANRVLTNNKKYFENVYIPFAPGDNGGAIGAALVVQAKSGYNLNNGGSPYLGKKFSDEYVQKLIISSPYNVKITSKFINDESQLCKTTAKLISEGKVIGWFQGKMEFGPRALGNRSILADPRNANMKSIINMKIKRRESFRPFAPSVLEKFQTDWFDDSFISPYMSSLAFVKEKKKKIIPAITHIDGTARLQSVNFDTNPKFASLINAFYEITNVPILLNTSFNENEPIVMKPEEALNCLLRTDMDAIVINNFLIKKNNT